LQFVGDGAAADGVALIQNHPQPVHLRQHTRAGAGHHGLLSFVMGRDQWQQPSVNSEQQVRQCGSSASPPALPA
jgi:hypothetical protein